MLVLKDVCNSKCIYIDIRPSFLTKLYQKAIFLKQIQETHAKQLCHEYKNMRRIQTNSESNDDHKKKVKLSKSVADAATGLCRKMLRYRGKLSF